MKLSRRKLVASSFLGAGALGINALMSGVPQSVLKNPLAPSSAFAATAPQARTLIISCSQAGDPLNGNVPGTYGPGLEDVKHPEDPLMAPAQMQLGANSYTAATPWANLPASVRDRMLFFHHGTYINAHPNHPKTMRLTGGVANNEMLISGFAKLLQPMLGSTQAEPISLGARNGSELISYEGRLLANVSPAGLQLALGKGNIDLVARRDQVVDQLYDIYRTEGLDRHQQMLDALSRTRDEARTIEDAILTRLDTITGDNQDRELDQIRAAPVLAAMNLSPVITIRIPFGGDNHADTGLAAEIQQTVSGVQLINQLLANVETLQADGVLNQEVVFATLNVFGRTMSLQRKGLNGRDHNANHHCMVIVGDSIEPGVIGGIAPAGNDWGATAINAATGASDEAGDIPYEQTFHSAAKTLGCALGIPVAQLDELVALGQPVPAAFKA